MPSPAIGYSGIIGMETKKAVLIRAHDGDIIVTGTERDESLQLYTLEGRQVCNVAADNERTVIPCNLDRSQIAIVRYSGKSVEILK